MRHYLLLFILVLNTFYSSSQKQNNIWYFGNNCGLDFNNGSPVSLNNGKMTTIEGCSVISNASGQLLFYSNGRNVWNRNHQFMPNGRLLKGDPSSCQSSIIIPKPGSNTIYYLFTTGAGSSGGLYYNEIDITLEAGLGNITSQKNILLSTPVCEKLCAVKNSADNSFWVVTHAMGSNSFLSFKVDSSGINSNPIISNSGSNISGSMSGGLEFIGYLKVSPDGSKIVSVNCTVDVQLFDFNRATGQISNPLTINTIRNWSCYGAEFSPTGNVLYITADSLRGFYQDTLLQYDLTAIDVPSSETIIYSSLFADIAGLQLAPDCKIYANNPNRKTLHVIENPDLLGISCNFHASNLLLRGGSNYSLPQFIQNTNCKSRVILNDDLCIGDAASFYLGGDDQILQATWHFGDGNASNQVRPTHVYSAPGNYIVTGDFATQSGNFTISKQITVAENPLANSVPDVEFCGQTSATYDLTNLNASILGNQSNQIYGISYFANNTDAVLHNNLLTLVQNFSSTTTIYAKVYRLSNFDCYSLISFKILLTDYPILNPITDFMICDDGLSNDGLASFDLNSKTPEILNGQSTSDFSVKYFKNANDAQNNTNSITTPFNNATNPQTIYARIAALPSEECFLIGTFNLVVTPAPEVNLQPKYTLCLQNGNPIRINLQNNFQSYLWSNGSQTNATNITAPGNYWVTVTQNQNQIVCSRTFPFEVVLSDKAIIKNIEIHDWTDNQNTIEIIIDQQSIGDYEYSIDGINYQDANVFQNLSPQEYSVYIKDKNGCGITTDQVFLLMYPKFFTPNEDGYNDTWEIKFSEIEPNLSIEIFDRYGKLLAQNVKQWDGKFQGNLLPSDDYWFIVKRENGKIYKGHFSLKR